MLPPAMGSTILHHISLFDVSDTGASPWKWRGFGHCAPFSFDPSKFPHVPSLPPFVPKSVPLMSQPVPFAPHVSACPICPKSVPLMSWPACSQFPSYPSLLPLLPLPETLLHCQPVLYPWAKVCILSDLTIRLSSFVERSILFTCSVLRLCWLLRMTFVVPSCGFSPLSDFLCVRKKSLYEAPFVVVNHAFVASEWR